MTRRSHSGRPRKSGGSGEQKAGQQNGGQQKGRQQGRRRSTQKAPVDQSPFEVDIQRLSHDGRGVAQQEGKTLFVEGALPGERVTAKLIACHSRFNEALALHIQNPSSDRLTPPCPHYADCGGCSLQHISHEQQLQLKQDAVLDQLQRWAGVVPEQILPTISTSPLAYRNRARLSVWYEASGELTLGFRRRHSKELVAIEQCLVLSARLNDLIAPLRAWLLSLTNRRAVSHIELLESVETVTVVVRHTESLSDDDRQSLKLLATDFDAQLWLQADAKGALLSLDGEPCDPRLVYQLPAFSPSGSELEPEQEQELSISYHPQDFIQVNSEVNRQMIVQALSLLDLKGDERVLDLFCGIGNFTLPLARKAENVVGVEAVESMVARGRESAEANHIDNISFVAADLEKDVSRHAWARGSVFDAAVLDPPRAGAKAAVDFLAKLSVPKLVYVSCNPSTLARDAQFLAEQGYRMQALGIMDMFPQTAHTESMALFIRKANS